MRSLTRALLLASVLIVITPNVAAADWQFIPFIGFTFKGVTTLIDDEGGVAATHWHLGGAGRLIGDGPFGAEGLFIHTPGFFERDEGDLTAANLQATVTESRTTAVMGNAVLTIPRKWNQYGLRPFVSGGLGLMHVASKDLHDVHPIRLNLVGVNLGGGAVGFINDRVGLNFDLRYLRAVQAPDWLKIDPAVSIGPIRLRYWTMSFGVVIKK